MRKRQDEQRGEVDLASDSARKMEMRISEFQSAESERRQTHRRFYRKAEHGLGRARPHLEGLADAF